MEKKLVRKFRESLRLLERVVEQRLRQESCCYGVGVAQCHTLLAIEKFQHLSLNQLADYMQLDKSTLSRTVETMVKAQLLTRNVDDEDRRAIRISLTPKGQKICDRINEGNDIYYEKVLSSCGSEPKEVERIFREIVQQMASELEQDKLQENQACKDPKQSNGE